MPTPREIIPAIIAKNALEFEKRLTTLEKTKISLVQIDIMDGQFVANTTKADPEVAAKYKLDYELHLMTKSPELYLKAWQKVTTVKRAAIHAEIKKPLAPILKKIKSNGWETGMAINPDTSWQVIRDIIVDLNFVLMMAVYPGRHAAPFVPKVIDKIKSLRAAYPSLVIEVDGGVNAQTLPLLLRAGATRFAVGSAIWSSPNPIEAYQKLLKII